MKKKVFRSKLSFDKSDLIMERFALNAGMMIGRPAVLEEEKNRMFASFGFLGSVAANNNNGWSGGTIKSAKDVIPKPEDYVSVPFRLLSATIVGAGSWKATDFSNAAALKASHTKLDGKSVYKNHDYDDVNNTVGFISQPKWTESFTNSDGTKVPAGIDGVVNIDALSETKLARNVLSGSVYSNSVTVEFDWEMSHEFDNENDFMMNCGSMKDGSMVCRKMKQVHNYHESSMVFLGADPFAKIMDSTGNLRNIDVTGIVPFSKLPEAEQTAWKEAHEIQSRLINNKGLLVNFEIDKGVFSYAKSNFDKPVTKIKPKEADMKWTENLRKVLNLAEGVEITEADIARLQLADPTAGANKAKASILDTLLGVEIATFDKEDVTKVTLTGEGEAVKLDAIVPTEMVLVKKADLASFKATLKTKEELAKVGESFIGDKRKEAVRLYKLSVGGEDKADAAVLGLFDKATSDELTGLLKLHAGGVTEAFGGKCKSCGNAEFEFRSSFQIKETEDNADGERPVSMDSLREKFGRSPMSLRK